jgi:hypothetical protein
MLGADFTAQTAAIAGEGAGVRITNEGSDYTHNWSMTREVATATRHYGTFCGFEPASGVDAKGVVARVYNATASGARQLHDYTPNTLGQGAAAMQNFRSNAVHLIPRQPRVAAALYLAREAWALDPGTIAPAYTLARTLRDATDIDFVTRRTAMDGHLRDYRAVVLAEAPVLEPAAAAALESWVRAGGTLIAVTRPGEVLGGRLHDNSAWRARLLTTNVAAGELLQPTLVGAVPSHWSLAIGSNSDQAWLSGDWFARERGQEWKEVPGATMRWSGGRPGVWLPVTPGAAHTLRVSLSVPGLALGTAGIRVSVRGQSVGVIRKAGKQVCEFALPASVLGAGPLVPLEFLASTWKPSVHDPASKDDRALGFSLHRVELVRAGSEGSPAMTATLRLTVNQQRLAPLARAVGQGRTIHLPGLAEHHSVVAAVLSSTLDGAVDGQLDERFSTTTDQGVLWFDAKSARIWETKQ